MRRRIPADLETPVSAFLKLRARGAVFLLESVEQGIQVGRLPEQVMMQILLPRMAQAERTVSFAMHPNRGLMLQMILDGGARRTQQVTSFEAGEQAVAEALKNDPELAALVV